MVACRYGISLLVFNSISHSFAASSSTLEEKIHIYARPCYTCQLFLRQMREILSRHDRDFRKRLGDFRKLPNVAEHVRRCSGDL